MSNPYYNHNDGVPAAQSRAQSVVVRNELDLVASGFDAVLADINLRLGSIPGSPTFSGPVTFNGAVTFNQVPQGPTSIGVALGLVNENRLAQAIAGVGTLGDLQNTAVTSSGTASVNTRELCRAATAISRTIPAGLSVGAIIGWKDDGQDFSINTLTIVPPAGHQIEWGAINEAMTVYDRGAYFVLIQSQAGIWRLL